MYCPSMSANLLTTHLSPACQEPWPVSCWAILQSEGRCPEVACPLSLGKLAGESRCLEGYSKSALKQLFYSLCPESAVDSLWGLWISFSFSLWLSFSTVNIRKNKKAMFWMENPALSRLNPQKDFWGFFFFKDLSPYLLSHYCLLFCFVFFIFVFDWHVVLSHHEKNSTSQIWGFILFGKFQLLISYRYFFKT